MTDFKVGDVVVCVDASHHDGRGGAAWPSHCAELSKLTTGKVYRVELLDHEGDIMRLSGITYRALMGAFGSHRFRRLPKANDEQFIAKIRACKPIKQNA